MSFVQPPRPTEVDMEMRRQDEEERERESGSYPHQDRPGPSGPRAGFWIRFGAALIDGLIVGVVSNLIFRAIGVSTAVSELISLVLSLSYFTYFEGSTGQTLGKRAVGIRVIGFDSGETIGYGRAATRYVASLLSGLCIFIGYLWMLWDREKQTWHDKLSTSVVVPVGDYR
jgi:uncharacterized RDD family membrane protein YckC